MWQLGTFEITDATTAIIQRTGAALMLRYIREEADDDVWTAIRIARPTFLASIDDFLDFCEDAVEKGILTEDGGLQLL
jgi:hypothetical protein